ncbi:MAG: peptidylprolyl isomerase [Gammaproteobacteria bacterium]|nr:peptidylprolyl isomerase [Gammaproteobacteria bacterium]
MNNALKLALRRGLIGLSVAATAMLALTSNAHAAPQKLEGIIALINDEVVLTSELDDAVTNIQAQFKQNGGQLPPISVLQQKVLERLVLVKLQLQRASQMGINISESQLNQALTNIAQRNNMSLADFAKALRKDGLSYLDFRNSVREELTVTQLRRRMVDSRIQVTEREIDDALATLSAQARADQSYRLQHILISSPEAASPELLETKRARALELIERLQNGEEFEQLAVAYSDGQNALEGGDLGWRKLTEVPSLFVDALNTLKVGEHTVEPIQSPSGFHLLRLAETRGNYDNRIQEVKARHILVQVNQVVSDSTARATLRTIQDRLDNGDSFADLAKEYSDDSGSKDKGGDLGWQDPTNFVDGFEDAVRTLPLNKISPPVRSQFGYHIIEVLERRERDATEELRRLEVRNDIANRKLQEETQLWQRRLLDEAYIEYRL